jgi:hypothetical protein
MALSLHISKETGFRGLSIDTPNTHRKSHVRKGDGVCVAGVGCPR